MEAGEAVGQHGKNACALVLGVEHDALIGEFGKHVIEAGQHHHARASQWEGRPTVGGIAIADVEGLQFGERMVVDITAGFGATLQHEIVKHRELPVAGHPEVDLNDRRPRLEGCAYRLSHCARPRRTAIS